MNVLYLVNDDIYGGSQRGGEPRHAGFHPWRHFWSAADRHVDLWPQLWPLRQHLSCGDHQLTQLGQIQVQEIMLADTNMERK